MIKWIGPGRVDRARFCFGRESGSPRPERNHFSTANDVKLPTAAPENATTYALNVSPGNVSRIDVTTAGKSTAFERLDPVGWKFADSGNQADTSRVDSVVAATHIARRSLERNRSEGRDLDSPATEEQPAAGSVMATFTP